MDVGNQSCQRRWGKGSDLGSKSVSFIVEFVENCYMRVTENPWARSICIRQEPRIADKLPSFGLTCAAPATRRLSHNTGPGEGPGFCQCANTLCIRLSDGTTVEGT